MSSVVTTSENGLKMKIKRKSTLGKIISDVETISGSQFTSPFKQKFVLENDNSEKKKAETVTKLSTKILQAGKNKGKNKKQTKPSKEKKMKKRIHRVGSSGNINKCLSSTEKGSPDCLGESNSLKLNGSHILSRRERDDSIKRESVTPITTSSPSSNVPDHQSSSLVSFLSTKTSFDMKKATSSNPKVTEKQVQSRDKSTEVTMRDVETETTHVGIVTDPDCLGPCEPGTSVVLEGIVWNESDNGILVVNVTWRGKTYVGTLMDSTKHHWAPPRLSEEELSSSSQSSYGGWGGCSYSQKSRVEETVSETRKPRRCRKDAAAVASHHTKFSKASHLTTLSITKEYLTSSNTDAQSKNKVGLFECHEENCSKKFKHMAGLRYHQSHAHCKKKEKDKLSSSDSRSSPSSKSSDKQLTTNGKSTDNISNMTVTTAPSSCSSVVEPSIVSVNSKPSQPAAKNEEIINKSSPETSKPSPVEVASCCTGELKTINNDNSEWILVASDRDSTKSPKAENLTKEVKPSDRSPILNIDSSVVSSKKDTCDQKIETKTTSATSTEPHNEVRSDGWKENSSNISSISQKTNEGRNEIVKRHLSSSSSSTSSSSQETHRHPSSSSNSKKHTSPSEFAPTPKKMKTTEDNRLPEEDPFYKAFRSMFENSPLPLDYFIDPFYRAQSLSMMSDPLLFHKNLLESRNRMAKNSLDDLKPVDMSSKKVPTPKPEISSYWPTYLPPSATPSSNHFFGSLKDCGSDVTSRSVNENFSSPLPSPKDKSLPKLQRFSSNTNRFFESSNRCPSTGGSRDEGGGPLRNYERDFNLKHKRPEDFQSQKNGKLKDDPRKSTSSNYSKQDIFRSPLPPPLLPSSFPFFPSQHPSIYSSPHISPHSLDSLDKSSSHLRRHQSPTVGERFKFPNMAEPPPPKQNTGTSSRTSAASAPSMQKSHPETPPAPKHHLHTHHHTHIIKTPYPMYSQYAASLLTTPPIVPTVVVPEIFSPK